MTPEQEKEWNSFACMSRSLIKATEIKKQPITADDFRTRYDKLFPPKQYGGLILSDLLFIAKDLKMGDRADFCFDYSRTEEAFNRFGLFAFIFSGIDLNKGCLGVLNHCSVLTGIDKTAGFSIWTPSNDGTDHLLCFPVQEWHEKKFGALTIF